MTRRTTFLRWLTCKRTPAGLLAVVGCLSLVEPVRAKPEPEPYLVQADGVLRARLVRTMQRVAADRGLAIRADDVSYGSTEGAFIANASLAGTETLTTLDPAGTDLALVFIAHDSTTACAAPGFYTIRAFGPTAPPSPTASTPVRVQWFTAGGVIARDTAEARLEPDLVPPRDPGRVESSTSVSIGRFRCIDYHFVGGLLDGLMLIDCCP